MIVNPLSQRQYKLIEFDNGLLILDPKDSLHGRKDMVELIIADMPTICEYLVRYHEFRIHGLGIRDAHQRALYGAKITSPGVLDIPEDSRVKQ